MTYDMPLIVCLIIAVTDRTYISYSKYHKIMFDLKLNINCVGNVTMGTSIEDW